MVLVKVVNCITREEKSNSNSGLTVIILADFDLLQLPLEMMSLLQFDCVKAVARDFSLQMLCHRIKNFLFEDEGKRKKAIKKRA